MRRGLLIGAVVDMLAKTGDKLYPGRRRFTGQ
jgi:hypothetical protein